LKSQQFLKGESQMDLNEREDRLGYVIEFIANLFLFAKVPSSSIYPPHL